MITQTQTFLKLYVVVNDGCLDDEWETMFQELNFNSQEEIEAFKRGVGFVNGMSEEVLYFQDKKECEDYCKCITGQE